MIVTAAWLVMVLMSGDANSPARPSTTSAGDPNVIAVVFDEKIMAKDRKNVASKIGAALMDRFARENRIEPNEAEINGHIAGMVKMQGRLRVQSEEYRAKLMEELKNPSLSDQQRKEKQSTLETVEKNLKYQKEQEEQNKGKPESEEVRNIKRQIASQVVRTWKVNKALYAKYGGRVIFQQAGPEPLDAYRDFLKEQERQGAFRIFDKQCEADFWRYFTNETRHTFLSEPDAAKAMNTPWWLLDKPPQR